ncbi:Ppx-GppA phosphatase protein (Exopolyphosphatase) [Quillaja saponaria]|uniref:Ppx-GppA phosphatase protein (Exopolyphosphatase) n=1 Tax=Quillaja saponaria TaxID=32244 RepID=A0AAD7Q2A5_QUISA|nr:Ppx-GppA phosphatase protein (Exopolyphosphatase) [Quillaja saponaria]
MQIFPPRTTMAITFPTSSTASSLFASIDMGTNSFKLLIVRADSSGKFFPIDQLKEPVVLGRDTATIPYSISAQSQSRALEALQKFQTILNSHNVNRNGTICVATAAVREAKNKREFADCIKEKIGLEVDVLTGEEEARLAYLGVVQFLPIYDKLALTVDIGGGSTEFVIGKEGKVIFGTSLKLGHVSLTQKFQSIDKILEMREYIRSVIHDSGLVQKVKQHGFETAVGSSGTIRAIEKAVFHGYARDIVDKTVLVGECNRDWAFTRGELSNVVERLYGGGEEVKVMRDRFFKRRSEFIVAGAVLLEEIFQLLGVKEMEVSGYALGEGVIAETLSKVYGGYDLNTNARWRSVVQLAMRFNSKKRMRSAAQCAGIAKEIFECIRKFKDLAKNKVEFAASLNEKDLEYLEAACLLHNIGLVTGKKGYHKQSYSTILKSGHLPGYSAEEVQLIALLARHHRKKFPKSGHACFTEIPKEVQQRFRYLCAIIRISVALQHYQSLESQEMDSSYSQQDCNLGLQDRSEVHDQKLPTITHLVNSRMPELRKELEDFNMVFQQQFSVVVHSSTSELNH